MTTIDRDLLTSARPVINKALAAIAKEFGVKFELGSCRFDSTSATFKLNMVAAGKGTKGKSAEEIKAEADWKAKATSFGLKKAWLGKTIQSRRFGDVTIVGLCPNRHKYPVMVKGGGNKIVLLTVEAVNAQLVK